MTAEEKDNAIRCLNKLLEECREATPEERQSVDKYVESISTPTGVTFDGDCISRQTVINMLNDINAEVNDGCGYMYEHWMDYIKQLPSISQAKTGHWIIKGYNLGDDYIDECYVCSKCGEQALLYPYGRHLECLSDFCPNCGADMREKTKTSKPDISSYYGLRSYVGREDGES